MFPRPGSILSGKFWGHFTPKIFNFFSLGHSLEDLPFLWTEPGIFLTSPGLFLPGLVWQKVCSWSAISNQVYQGFLLKFLGILPFKVGSLGLTPILFMGRATNSTLGLFKGIFGLSVPV